jgi:dynein heavy chain
MLVGQTLSGKTVASNVLAKILSTQVEKDFKTTDIIRLNPKSITTDSLYGRLDPISKSWSDGVLPLLMRKCISLEDGHNKWITFDGPVDAVWIENMNTVLDDNKKLCLTSGEIIKLINGMTMLFEVEDLSQASPATVSRCGMVYLEASMLGWKSLISGLKFGEYFAAFKQQIIEESIRLIEVMLQFKHLKYSIVSEEMILVDCFRKLLVINLKELERKKKPPTKEIVNNLVVLSIVWSLGAVLHEDCRAGLSTYLLKHLEEVKLSGNNIFDFVFSVDRNAWV